MIIEKIQLEDDEEVLRKVRKHWFVLAVQVLGIVIVAILPVILYSVVYSAIGSFSPVEFDGAILLTLYCAWLLIAWMALFSVWTNYYLDIWFLTNKRLIVADQRGLFNRRTGSFRLERLQDINVTIQGIIPTFLDYGNLEAQTASEDVEFIAYSIPHPQEFKAQILSATDTITYTNGTRSAINSEV